MSKLFNKRGFTLIELIVVIIIIGVLATIAISSIGGYTKKAIVTEAIAGLRAVKMAEKAYYLEKGFYLFRGSGLNSSDYEVVRLEGLGLSGPELDGTYFSNRCYKANPDFAPLNYQGHAIQCFPYHSGLPAPEWNKAKALCPSQTVILMDLDSGHISFYNGINGEEYPI